MATWDCSTQHIVLIGMMGAGKSSVGRVLAERLGRPLFDSDQMIEERTGRTVREIWQAEGEPAFRALETEVLAEAVSADQPSVIAAAGGVVLSDDNRRILAESEAHVVWLMADVDLLLNRVKNGMHRPLLDDDPEGTLRHMFDTREALYPMRPTRSCRSIIVRSTTSPGPCSGAAPDPEVDMQRVSVPLSDRSYDVVVGAGAIEQIGSLIPERARRLAVVTQAGIPARFVDIESFVDGREVEVFEIGVGESSKSLGTIEQLMRSFAAMGLTRNDAVVGVGGGMVTDVAGFAAASWHRGVPVVHVSTSLLGMVDAAIGGKTGVNLPEGKNLVGAFWQPSGVVCDLDGLDTLPEREMRCGLGEMAKYHFLTGDDLLAMDLETRIARCVEIKAEVVASDEREGGRRALLNYGHTLAHALEIATNHELAHGEAVAIGLIYAAELGHELGRIDSARVDEHLAVVEGEYHLATRPPVGLDVDELVALMGRDKKALDGLTFILDSAQGVEVVAGVDPAPVRSALTRFLTA